MNFFEGFLIGGFFGALLMAIAAGSGRRGDD